MKRYNSMTYPYDDVDTFHQSMKRDIMRIYFLALIILLTTACSPVPSQMVEPTQTFMPILTDPTQSNTSPMPQNPLSPKLETLIKTAKEDLAGRLSVSTSEIILLDARDVTWSDSSLGCPQPGMVYAEALTTGYLIVLNANNKDYEYHAGRISDIFLCENPTPPVPGIPGDV